MAVISGTTGADTISPALVTAGVTGLVEPDLAADDRIQGLGADDLIDGGGGADTLSGGLGADTLRGGQGNDLVAFQTGEIAAGEIYDGGAGTDIADFGNNADLDISGLSLIGVERLKLRNGTIIAAGQFDDVTHIDYTGDFYTLFGASAGTYDFSGITFDGHYRGFTGSAGDDRIIASGFGAVNGGAGNDTIQGSARADNLNGGAGDGDVVSFGGSATPLTIDLTAGTATGGDATGDILAGFEGAGGGAGADSLRGNAAGNELLGAGGNDNMAGEGGDDRLFGDAGDDTLDGGRGADTLTGGLGNDRFVVDNAGDVTLDVAGGGIDTVVAAVSHTLGAQIEVLRLTAAAHGTGNASANTLIGSAFADTLDGGLGDDRLEGGLGNDLYLVADSGDQVLELPGGGADTVVASANHTLRAEVEVLRLAAGAMGRGNEAANTLIGSDFNDTLDGGAGPDRLAGGLGNDRYVVDDAGDVVVELPGGGADTVVSAVSLTLAAEVEALRLSAAAHAIGNDLANTIIGSDFADTLEGGLGADTLRGGRGDDLYIVNDAGDLAQEGAGGGNDTVISSVTYLAGDHVEVLRLTASARGNGGVFANTLIGSDFADTLDGGFGADRLEGGLGNDLYIVDNILDVTVDAGAGADTVMAFASHTLGAQIEMLQLAARAVGTGNGLANTLVGSSFADTLQGDAGNDILAGGDGADRLDGGTGNDRLSGGRGDDTYIVDSAGDVVSEANGDGHDQVWSSLSYTIGAGLEELYLLGTATTGIGNDGDNRLWGTDLGVVLQGMGGEDRLAGGAGADTLDGGLGADELIGGQGDDLFFVDDVADDVLESPTGGADTVIAAVNHALDEGVEVLRLTAAARAWGREAASTLIGSDFADTLTGYRGNDLLSGGLGDDLYTVEAGDVVTEAAGGGADTVQASGSYVIGAAIEGLRLLTTGIGTGNSLANTMLGSDSSRVTLRGAAGNDTLQSGRSGASLEGDDGHDRLLGSGADDVLNGGRGNDVMRGGLGNDLYVVDSLGDVADEGDGAGWDTVNAALSFTLGAGVEVLQLLGTAVAGSGNDGANTLVGSGIANLLSGGDGADSIIGGKQADTLSGEGGADTLDGGAGFADSLLGGADDDVYIIRDTLDLIVEQAGEGTLDTVRSTVSLTLAAEVEQLRLLGTDNLSGTGNATANILVGNDGANLLEGRGGADSLNGGVGADTLRGEEGDDTLSGGTGSDVMEGGAGNDSLVASSGGGDTLIGGAGQDRLVGQAGVADSFRWAAASEGGGSRGDVIQGFEHLSDRLEFAAAGFGGLSPGALPAANFILAAPSAGGLPFGTPLFIFQPTTRTLYWDGDGGGFVAVPVAIASFGGTAAITAEDIIIIA